MLLADWLDGFSCRYDGRGALYDLKQYEAQPGGHDANRWVGLSEAERRVEQLCDEERYRALHHNEEEEALYQGRIILKLVLEFSLFLLKIYFFSMCSCFYWSVKRPLSLCQSVNVIFCMWTPVNFS